jgi:hypothetical protein
VSPYRFSLLLCQPLLQVAHNCAGDLEFQIIGHLIPHASSLPPGDGGSFGTEARDSGVSGEWRATKRVERGAVLSLDMDEAEADEQGMWVPGEGEGGTGGRRGVRGCQRYQGEVWEQRGVHDLPLHHNLVKWALGFSGRLVLNGCLCSKEPDLASALLFHPAAVLHPTWSEWFGAMSGGWKGAGHHEGDSWEVLCNRRPAFLHGLAPCWGNFTFSLDVGVSGQVNQQQLRQRTCLPPTVGGGLVQTAPVVKA